MKQEKNERIVLETLKQYEKQLISPEICKNCGGKCCKQSGCECHPRDFEYNTDKMYQALKTGKYSISLCTKDFGCFCDTFYGVTLNPEVIKCNPNYTLYIRMRNKNHPVVDLIHFGKVEGPCSIWSPESGCSLTFEERPLGGKLLHPQSDGPNGELVMCRSPLSRKFLIDSWRDYQEILLTYAEAFLTVEDVKWYHTTLQVPFYL